MTFKDILTIFKKTLNTYSLYPYQLMHNTYDQLIYAYSVWLSFWILDRNATIVDVWVNVDIDVTIIVLKI